MDGQKDGYIALGLVLSNHFKIMRGYLGISPFYLFLRLFGQCCPSKFRHAPSLVFLLFLIAIFFCLVLLSD